MIGVIVLFSRPTFAASIRANLARQAFREFVPIIIENGPAVGAWRNSEDVAVLSRANRSSARNEGIERCKVLGLEHWAIFEDDDWYGPGYLQEVWDNRDQADVTGKHTYVLQGTDASRWLMFPGNEHRVLGSSEGAFLDGGLLAATLAGRTDRALPFDTNCPVAEEVFWFIDMLRSGRTLYSRGSENFVMKRYGPPHEHTTPMHWTREVQDAKALRI